VCFQKSLKKFTDWLDENRPDITSMFSDGKPGKTLQTVVERLWGQ